MSKPACAAVALLATLAAAQARAEYWMDAVVCNDGRVKLQIEAGERRASRLVITDRQVKNYFMRALTTPRDDDRGFGGGVFEYFERDRNFSPRLEGPMVVRAWSEHGAFRIEQFEQSHQGPRIHTTGVVDCAPHSGGCGDQGPAVDIRRFGDGLKVEIWRPRFHGRICVETDPYSGQCLAYTSTGEWEAREIANWWLPGCELRPLLP